MSSLSLPVPRHARLDHDGAPQSAVRAALSGADPERGPDMPAIETLRGLLLGSGIGHNGWLTVVWCVGPAVLDYYRSRSLFNRETR